MKVFNRISHYPLEEPMHASGRWQEADFHRVLRESLDEAGSSADLSSSGLWTTGRPTEEDLRIHAWLTRRLAVLHDERYGYWSRARRLFRSVAGFLLSPFVRKERRLRD